MSRKQLLDAIVATTTSRSIEAIEQHQERNTNALWSGEKFAVDQIPIRQLQDGGSSVDEAANYTKVPAVLNIECLAFSSQTIDHVLPRLR